MHPEFGATTHKGFRPHKCFIVKARSEKLTKKRVHRAHIKTYIGPGILASGNKPFVKLLHSCLDVGISAIPFTNSNHGARLFNPCRHNAPGSMIFEATAQN